MSTQTQAVSTAVTSATPQQQAADNFLTQFTELIKLLPAAKDQPAMNTQFVRTHLNVSDEFLRAAVDTLEKIPGIAGVTSFDAATAREMLQTLDAFGPVVKQLVATTAGAQFALNSIKAALVNSALRAYYVAKRMARDTEPLAGPSPVGVHAEVLKKTLGRKNGTKATGSPAPTPSPAPPVFAIVLEEEVPQNRN